MATAEKTAPVPAPSTTDELFLLLGEESMAVADLLDKHPHLRAAMAKAWAAGDVEFGRAAHCVTGRPGLPESKPTLIVESGVEWSGAKTPKHKKLAGVLEDGARVPDCSEYKKYVLEVLQGKDENGVERWRVQPVKDGDETRWTTVKIDRAEAVALMALRVQLTDKGAAALQA